LSRFDEAAGLGERLRLSDGDTLRRRGDNSAVTVPGAAGAGAGDPAVTLLASLASGLISGLASALASFLAGSLTLLLDLDFLASFFAFLALCFLRFFEDSSSELLLLLEEDELDDEFELDEEDDEVDDDRRRRFFLSLALPESFAGLAAVSAGLIASVVSTATGQPRRPTMRDLRHRTIGHTSKMCTGHFQLQLAAVSDDDRHNRCKQAGRRVALSVIHV